MKTSRGFTLIELLIVVAIIGILAAIAIPNFLQAQTRSKVARAEAEMRQVATALESYYIDNNVYPPPSNCDTDPGNTIPNGALVDGSVAVDQTTGIAVAQDAGVTAINVTTPIAYITSLPTDPFRSNQEGLYSYGTKILTCWILHSYGPDTVADTTDLETNYVTDCNIKTDAGGADLAPDYAYDPTNGTTSVGDIVRVGP